MSKVIKSESLGSIAEIEHGFLNRNISSHHDYISKQPGITRLITLDQIHSTDVIVIDSAQSTIDNITGDALATNLRGISLGIKTADCVPVLFADTVSNTVAASHSGWKGTLGEIAVSTVSVMRHHFGAEPKNIRAVIGPAISGCCYEVSMDVAKPFMDKFEDHHSFLSQKSNDKYILDLKKAIQNSLLRLNLKSIETMDSCTNCETIYYSYRREGKGVGGQLSYIAIMV